MPEAVNTSFLGASAASQDAEAKDNRPIMVKIDDVSMIFNMASETMNNLKEYAIALARRELRFKEFRALDHISFEVRKGDVFGILGTNGSGKSTLLKIIAGVMEPSEGTCTVNGGIAPLIELGAGFDMELTARENIYLNGALLGYSKSFINEHFDEIVAFAEIEKFLDMPLKNYSSGMVARIAFAIATAIVPDVLIVDEVLSVGDFMFQQKCERRIQSLIKDHGVTVLIVSHSTDQVERLCNRAIWIEKGHERIIGSAREVCQVYRVLGGHFGSAEAEQEVFELLQKPYTGPEDFIETFTGETRYSTSVKIMEALPAGFAPNKAIIAPGQNPAVCMVANALSSLDNTPILLTRPDTLPEMVEQKLRATQPEAITILGGPSFIDTEIVKALRRITPNAHISVLDAETEEHLALQAYQSVPRKSWGSKAVLTYPGCAGDMLCFLPYIYRHRLPLFFNHADGAIQDATTQSLLQGGFDEVLVLGGQASFPDSCLKPLNEGGVVTTRFCGSDPFDANTTINEWIESEEGLQDAGFQFFIVPVWNPRDALVSGPLAKTRNGLVLMEDTQNLDSTYRNLKEVKRNKETLMKLVFFGDATLFSPSDKAVLAHGVQ